MKELGNATGVWFVLFQKDAVDECARFDTVHFEAVNQVLRFYVSDQNVMSSSPNTA